MNTNFILTYLLLTPFIGSILVLFLKESNGKIIRWFGFGISIVTFIISVFAYYMFNTKSGDFQLINQFLWIKSLNTSYTVGIDGISLLLILLTTFLTPLTLLSTWKSITKNVKMFTFCMLFLETGMLGVFMSLDLFLFYIFWEVMLIPMYFIIGVWGGEKRIYASVKFFIYTMAGSLLMLIAIIWLASSASWQLGHFTTSFIELSKVAPNIVIGVQSLLFFAFFISFAIKVPIFPFHTWLPDAHVQAPTAGSVILAGVLLKMGTYGLLRFCLTLFPQSSIKFAPFISVLAVIGIIYGALVAMVQTDMKKLVAYSSISHLGFVVLGLFAMTIQSVQGSVIQMINHGLSTGALFLLVGFLYERTHNRDIAYYGGIARLVPLYSFVLLFISLSSIGLPGLNGFIGEFLILLGSFKSEVLGSWWFTIFASSGVIFAAVYLLWMYERVVFGEVKNQSLAGLKDLTAAEILIIVPIFIFIVWIGLYPSTFLDITSASVERILTQINSFHNINF
jgi:NADH-quinone oxidoreductase subunit M